MAEQLYLNNKLVPLGVKPITRKIQIGDVGEVSARKSSYSYTIKIRKTTETVKNFDMLGVMGNTSRKPFELIRADYIRDSIILIEDGLAKIKSTSEFFEINIFDGVKSLAEKLNNKKLSDLPLDDLNHYLTAQAYIDSYSNKEGFIYCIANYGLGVNTTTLKVEKQAPSIFTHTLVRKIFESIDLNLVGEFFTTNDNYLNEVITPAKGYLIEDVPLTETAKGAVISDILKDNAITLQPISEEKYFTFSDDGLVDASIVDGNIMFAVAGSYKLDLTINTDTFNTFASLRFLVNNIVKASISITEGYNEVKLTSIVFSVDAGDVVSIRLSATSDYDPSGIGDDNRFQISYNANITAALTFQEGGKLITASDYVGEMNQFDLIKDVVNRYGLVVKPVQNSSDYEFKRLEVILNDRANAEDWTLKLKEITKEGYISNYAKSNKAVYQYPEAIVIPNNDGEMIIENENASEEKTFFSSLFEIPEESITTSTGLTYAVPVWQLNDEQETELLETPLKVMSIKRIDSTITAKLFTDVVGVSFTGGIPFLSLENMSMNYFLKNFYKAFQSLINNYKQINALFNLSVVDIYNLDFFKLKFLKQTGRFYYLNTVTNTANTISKTVLTEISEFLQNEPPSQVGDYSFIMNHNSTKTIIASNLLNNYLDPEEDAPLSFKILSGFNSDLIMYQDGVEITSEIEIPVEDLKLTVFDALGGLTGYAKEFTFTISDVGSGVYSSATGTITANIAEIVNEAPIAVADANTEQLDLPPEDIEYSIYAYLDGSASYDNTGEIISYFWEIVSAPIGSTAKIITPISGTASKTWSVEIPNEAYNAGTYNFKLTVTDEFGLTGEDEVEILINL